MSLAAPAAGADAAEDAVGDEPPAGPLARIQSVEIENLRGIRTGKLEGLAPLTILTGPNGSGKSTVLDALDIGGSPNPHSAVIAAVTRRHPPINLGARWLSWRGLGGKASVRCTGECGERLRVLKFETTSPDESLTVTVICYKSGEPGGGADPFAFTLRYHPNGAFGVSGDHPPRPRPVGLEFPCVREVAVVGGLPAVGPLGASRPASRLYSLAIERGRDAAVRELAGRLIPGAEDLRVLTEADGSSVLHAQWPSSHSLPVGHSGDGVYAAVRTALELAVIWDGVALLEEPEAHLHPAAMALVARAIVNAVRSGTQVVLTTHSLEFLDCLLDESEGEPDDFLALFRVHLREGELASVRHAGPDVRFVREEVAKDLR